MTEVFYNSEKIKVLIDVIKEAKNDSEKCAALLAVSRMVNASDLTEEQRRDIFLAVGFSLPLRLITSKGSEDCPKDVLVELGLTLLSTIVRNLELAQSPENKNVVPVLMKLMKDNCNDVADSNCKWVIDCFQYLTLISATDAGCRLILANNGLKYLVSTFFIDSPIHDSLFWNLLHQLIRYNADIVWNDNRQNMLTLLNYVSEKSLLDFSENKFLLYDHLCLLLSSLSVSYADLYFDHQWVNQLKQSLCEIFQSKIGEKQRNPSLKLCHQLTEIFGLKWCIESEKIKNKQSLVFPHLLIKLVCVEMRMIIYNWTSQKNSLENICDSSEMSVYMSCSALFEAACTNIANFDQCDAADEVFDFKAIEDLQKSFAETVETISDNLLPCVVDESKLGDFVVSCLRTVGSWFNVEVFASSKLGFDLISKLFPVFKTSLLYDRVTAINSFTPAFLHYAETSTSRNPSLETDIISCLLDLVLDPTLESIESKTLCTQCLMTFCIESEQLELLNDLLSPIMDFSLKLDQSLVLCFYVFTLAVMLWNKSSNAVNEYPQCERFFRKLISLLHGIHSSKSRTVKVTNR